MCESISFSSSAKKEHKGISSHSKSCALLTSTKKNCCKDEDFRTKILFDFSFFFFLRGGWGYSDGANRRFVLTADENLKLAFFPFHYKGFSSPLPPPQGMIFLLRNLAQKNQGILIFEQTYTNQSKSLPRILLGDDACFFRGLCRFLFSFWPCCREGGSLGLEWNNKSEYPNSQIKQEQQELTRYT